MNKTLCIYHANCADGFGAAWVVRKALGEQNVDFYAASYQEEPPAVAGRDVLIVDFSYKRPVMEQIAAEANSVLVLDHHESAERELTPLLESGLIKGTFSEDNSGVMLAWQHFFPDQYPLHLIASIEDRDLYQFQHADTKDLMAAVFSYPMEFPVWDQLLENTSLRSLQTEGKGIRRKQEKDTRDLIDNNAFRTTIAGYDVPVLNAPYIYASEAGNIMAEGEPFAAIFQITGNGRKYSLRSSKEGGANVSEIAELFGGGGHKNAAGFELEDIDLLYIAKSEGLPR